MWGRSRVLWTLGLAAALSGLLVWQALGEPAPAVAVFRRVAPAVVLITRGTTVPGAGGRLDWGSGVFMDHRGDIVTNHFPLVPLRRRSPARCGSWRRPAGLADTVPAARGFLRLRAVWRRG